jgi:hypothetical protein
MDEPDSVRGVSDTIHAHIKTPPLRQTEDELTIVILNTNALSCKHKPLHAPDHVDVAFIQGK